MDQYPQSPLIPAFSLSIEPELRLASRMVYPLRPSYEAGLRRPTSSWITWFAYSTAPSLTYVLTSLFVLGEWYI